MPKYGRIHRLLKILTLIQSEPGWNAKRLAEECDTSERNVYRDLNMIEAAGIPYSFNEQMQGYQVRRDFFMPPVKMTLEESLALIVLAHQIGDADQIPFMKPAARAIAKVRGQLPAKLQDELADLDHQIEIQLTQSTPGEGIQDVYDRVRHAIANRRAMQCSYESLNARQSDRDDSEVFIFKPYRLFFSHRAWYAVGLHEGRDEVRTLKLGRFIGAEVTDTPYAIPDDFSLEEQLGNAWRMIRGDTTYDVELHFDAEFAETIADTHWHKTQEIIWQKDESILFQCQVDGLDEILWWILGMGPHCTVRKPTELIDRVRELTQQVTATYAK